MSAHKAIDDVLVWPATATEPHPPLPIVPMCHVCCIRTSSILVYRDFAADEYKGIVKCHGKSEIVTISAGPGMPSDARIRGMRAFGG